MGTTTRSTWVDDDSTGTTGSIINNSELQTIYNNIDTEVKSASFPSVTTKSVQDNVMAGIPFNFAGSANVGTLLTAFPSGATGDKLAPNTGIWNVDSVLLTGTYKLEAVLASEGGATVSLELVNLTDGSPDTALVTITSTSATGQRVQSSAITFAGAGAAKDYGVKLKSSSGASHAWAWSIRVIRTA